MLSGFSQQILQDHIVEHAADQQPLELAVLLLKLAEQADIGHFQPAILTLQLAKRRRAQSMLPINLDRRQPGLLLLDHPDDRRLGKTALPQAPAPSRGQTLTSEREISRGPPHKYNQPNNFRLKPLKNRYSPLSFK